MNPNQSTHVSVDIRMGHDDDEVDDIHLDPRFSISQERLAEIVEMNDAVYLEQNGGIHGIAAALCSNTGTGIVGDERDIFCRRKAFGFNYCCKLLDEHELEHGAGPSRKRFHELVSEAFFKDSTIILLLCCAVLSLLIGIKTNGPQQGLVDGAIAFFTIFVVVNFGLMSRFFKARLILMKLKKQKKKEVVSVIRHGKVQEIPAPELVVGDVVLLEAGNQVPADGLFIHGDDSFKLDDDGDGLVEVGGIIMYISVFSGSKVVEGNCHMLVTAVGKNTERSKLILTRRNRGQELKLQAAIDKTNRRLENLWLILSLLILSVQGVRCFVQNYSASDDGESRSLDPNKGLKNTVEEIMNESSTRLMKRQGGRVNGLVSVLCVLLLANRDGLPLGILVLCFCSSRKMKSFGAKVQKLPACLSVGLVTSICLGKTNSLISQLHDTDMVELWIGGLTRVMNVTKEAHNHHLLKILREGICVTTNSSRQELTINKDSLVFWIKQVFGGLIDEDDWCSVPPASTLYNELSDCCMSILTRDEKENQVQMLHWKGAPDLILSLCSHYYDVDGTMQILDPEKRQDFTRLINDQNNIRGSDSSGTLLAFACKKINHHLLQVSNNNNKSDEEQYERNNVRSSIDDEELLMINSISRGFTLAALVRLKSTTPHAAEAMKALTAFRALGINAKLVVGEDVKAARIMALKCGLIILSSPAGENEDANIIMEASHFRNSSVETCMNMLRNVDVIANAFPADKLLIVQCLRKKGDDEVVALISSPFNRRDSPSLLEADVGISMMDDDAREAVVMEEEAADIMIFGQDIGTVASIIKEGRYLGKRIETFLQLHLVLNLSAFALNFVLEILRNKAQLTPYHLLWTNLIVETLGAFALSIAWVDRRSGLLNNARIPPPLMGGNINDGGAVITKIMWRNIATQSLFQVTVLVSLAMKGKDILDVDENVLSTMIFNCYVLCQVFALIGTIIQRTSCSTTTTSNSSDHDHDPVGRKNHENYNLPFIACMMILVALQVFLAEIMRLLFHWEKLDYKKWFICIGIAAVSVPIGCAVEWVSHVMMMMI